MAKKTDPFEKFRQATLGGNPLSSAISGAGSQPAAETHPVADTPLPSPAKKSKNEDRKLVSFHIDKQVFHSLGQLKFERGVKYDELYNEAMKDLLVKYGKI